MKVPRSTIGRMAELVWRDPFRLEVKGKKSDLSDMVIGEAMYPRQRERGVILAVRDGTIVICHTETQDSPLQEGDTVPTYDCTFVPEDRVESITLFVAEPKDGNGGA